MHHRQFVIWSGWLVVSLFYAYQYILRVLPNIILPFLTERYAMDGVLFGQFSGLYYTGYALAHVPLGILLDRFGVKKVLPLSFALTFLGILPIIYGSTWHYPAIGRLITGIGSSAAILGAFQYIRLVFSEGRFTRVLSMTVTVGLMGAIYGGQPTQYLCDTYGVYTVIHFLVVVGCLLSLAAYIIMPTSKKEHQKKIGFKEIFQILTNTRTLLLAIASGFMVGALEGFPDAWGVAFLTKVHNVTAKDAAQLTSFIFFGMCFGGPLLSYIADSTKRYVETIIGAGLVMTALFFIILFCSVPVSLLYIFFVIIGISCAYQIPAIYQASTYVEKQFTGLATALVNMVIMGFGHLLHSTIGATVNSYGGIDSVSGLHAGVLTVPITCVMGVMLLLLFRKSLEKGGS
ncbi:MAG: MFS transporter [Alphaproteobacteria bacterium]|nr:MFS transporter [Alphaproteobacteria bacterium]